MAIIRTLVEFVCQEENVKINMKLVEVALDFNAVIDIDVSMMLVVTLTMLVFVCYLTISRVLHPYDYITPLLVDHFPIFSINPLLCKTQASHHLEFHMIYVNQVFIFLVLILVVL